MTRPPCPTPFKMAYATHSIAMRVMREQQNKVGRVAVKVYRCPCGGWHVAGPTKPVSDETRKRNHRRKGGRSKYQPRSQRPTHDYR